MHSEHSCSRSACNSSKLFKHNTTDPATSFCILFFSCSLALLLYKQTFMLSSLDAGTIFSLCLLEAHFTGIHQFFLRSRFNYAYRSRKSLGNLEGFDRSQHSPLCLFDHGTVTQFRYAEVVRQCQRGAPSFAKSWQGSIWGVDEVYIERSILSISLVDLPMNEEVNTSPYWSLLNRMSSLEHMHVPCYSCQSVNVRVSIDGLESMSGQN